MKTPPKAPKEKRTDIIVKYIPKLKMWCKTYWDANGEQKQVWSNEKPNEQS